MGVQRPPQSAALTILALNVVVIALHASPGFAADELSNEDCFTLGFSDSLECDTCEKLQQLVSDRELYRECRSCCRVVSVEEVKYDEAKLQICD